MSKINYTYDPKLLVKYFQSQEGLEQDGIFGVQTLKHMLSGVVDRSPMPFLEPPKKNRSLAPTITSGHCKRNGDRPTHYGVDFFYAYQDWMGAVPKGDGGAAYSGGKPKWWVPDNTKCRAVMNGTVTMVDKTKTGWRIWLSSSVVPNFYAGYFHLSSVLEGIKVGSEVDVGEELGIVGDNPSDFDARHLHFELYYGDLREYPKGSLDPQEIAPEVFLR